MACSVTAASRPTAIRKWRNSSILQKELLPRKSENASNHLSHYQPFIELYERVRNEEPGKHDAKPERIAVTVPKGPPPTNNPASKTFVIAAMSDVIDQDKVREDFKCKVACIRGQGMVVGYAKLTGNTLVRPFVGLALGGRASDTTDAGVRGDVLLGFSEYVTHTKWDERSGVPLWLHERRFTVRILRGTRWETDRPLRGDRSSRKADGQGP